MLLNGQPITLTGFGKPIIIIITEFGADTLPGVHETPPEMWTEEYQVELLRRYLDVAAQRPFMAGMHVWNFADFETGQGTGRAAGVRVFLYEKGYLRAKTISIDPVQGLGCEAPLPAAVRAVHIGAWVEDPTLGRYHRFVGTRQRCMTRARAKPLEAHMGRATSRRVEPIRTAGADGAWPALPLAAWRDTYDTLHRWAQLVGKTRLALAPRENHWWHTPLYVTARGLTTSPIPYGDRTFEVDFDFVDHNLIIRTGDGATRALALVPRSVADFYREYTRILDSLGLRVRLWPVPVEVEHVIPLDEDHVHASYDAESAHRFWLALAQAARVLRAFRGRFLGKSSPVHFFWGSFDLACTRFSGRLAPEHPGASRTSPTGSRARRTRTSASARAGGREAARCRSPHSTHTPTPGPRVSPTHRCVRPQRVITRGCASSSCRTTPCARPISPRTCCSTFSRVLTTRPRIWRAGTAPRSSGPARESRRGALRDER